MDAITVYKFVHLIGLILTLLGLGLVIGFAANGGTKQQNRWRKGSSIMHGIGLSLLLLGGFGMLARLNIHWPLPGWVVFKLLLWLFLGAALALSYRRPRMTLLLVMISTVLAAYVGFTKPF